MKSLPPFKLIPEPLNMEKNDGKLGAAYLICWSCVYLLIDLPIQLTPGWSMIWSGYDSSPGQIGLVVAQALAAGLSNSIVFGSACACISLAVLYSVARIGASRWASLSVILANLMIVAMMFRLFIETDPLQPLTGALAPMTATMTSCFLLIFLNRRPGNDG